MASIFKLSYPVNYAVVISAAMESTVSWSRTTTNDKFYQHYSVDHLLRNGGGIEKKLRQILFTNYSKSQRPSTPVNISLNLVVSNLDEVVSEWLECSQK